MIYSLGNVKFNVISLYAVYLKKNEQLFAMHISKIINFFVESLKRTDDPRSDLINELKEETVFIV